MTKRIRSAAGAAALILSCLAPPAAGADPFSDLRAPPPSEAWRLKGDTLPNGVPIKRTDIPSYAFAVDTGINVRNGGWSVGYEMIGGAFAITYNSFAGHVGWFGRGWGSPFETRLLKMRDGTIYIQLNGTGAIATFGSGAAPRYASMMDDVITREAAQAHGTEAAIRRRLETQKGYAIELASKYGALAEPGVNLWKLTRDARTIDENCDESGFLVETPEGYILNCREHRTRFDAGGKLLSGETATQGEFSIRYDAAGKPLGVRGARNAFDLVWGDGGVVKVIPSAGAPDELAYDAAGRLISLRQGIAGFRYGFEYNERTDMTAIQYGDGTSRTMTYDGADALTSITERNGERTAVQVERHKPDGVLFWDYVSVLTIRPDGAASLRLYRLAPN